MDSDKYLYSQNTQFTHYWQAKKMVAKKEMILRGRQKEKEEERA